MAEAAHPDSEQRLDPLDDPHPGRSRVGFATRALPKERGKQPRQHDMAA